MKLNKIQHTLWLDKYNGYKEQSVYNEVWDCKTRRDGKNEPICNEYSETGNRNPKLSVLLTYQIITEGTFSSLKAISISNSIYSKVS